MNHAPSVLRRSVLALASLAIFSIACSAGSEEGLYHNGPGDLTLELRAGKATLTIGGASVQTTYKVQGDKIILKIEDETETLTREKDGSLSGPPNTGLSRLYRKKT
jgi:hypothetical protein